MYAVYGTGPVEEQHILLSYELFLRLPRIIFVQDTDQYWDFLFGDMTLSGVTLRLKVFSFCI